METQYSAIKDNLRNSRAEKAEELADYFSEFLRRVRMPYKSGDGVPVPLEKK